jgi:hypothetical protein
MNISLWTGFPFVSGLAYLVHPSPLPFLHYSVVLVMIPNYSSGRETTYASPSVQGSTYAPGQTLQKRTH